MDSSKINDDRIAIRTLQVIPRNLNTWLCRINQGDENYMRINELEDFIYQINSSYISLFRRIIKEYIQTYQAFIIDFTVGTITPYYFNYDGYIEEKRSEILKGDAFTNQEVEKKNDRDFIKSWNKKFSLFVRKRTKNENK